jgi:hypothetical protein
MNVFLWQAKGADTIFETETDMDISNLIVRIAIICHGWGWDREIDHLRMTLAETPIAIRVEIAKFFNRHCEDEHFEFGRFLSTTRLS